MKKEAAALLLGYFASQHEEINLLYAKVQQTDPDSEELTVYLGYQLHNLYCALEDLFAEIAKTFENQVEDPSRFHMALLKRMQVEVPNIRPRVLSRESHRLLNELRAFRHVFRHAYSYNLEREKVRAVKETVIKQWHGVLSDLSGFESFLRNILTAQE